MIFADVFKLRLGHTGVGRAPVTGVFIRERRGTFAHRDTDAHIHVRTHTPPENTM